MDFEENNSSETGDELYPSGEGQGDTGAAGDDHPIETGHVAQLTGMYENWFLDYASYVILERAVPHITDGLKPVQRRLLFAMRQIEDGRYNKVANIIGQTMQYHPHGDASIGDALVQLGQKDLLIDTQGNWGNLLTGDSAAASRYIEARLSKFALEVAFNPKTTEWKMSYDGRNREPVTLPVKFPLLLAQGVEGIAVGLASKILPHNFIELADASIACLQGKPFELLPDFPTGGYVDASRYNDGLRGGAVRIRAKISKVDKKTLVINDLPFGQTTSSLIDSILKANEKGKIKIRKIDDNTSDKVEILIHLLPGADPDITIDALYAFTDCEISISPNSCVIADEKPVFTGVSSILKINTENTVQLLKRELGIRLDELEEAWHSDSLEKIFIVNELYEPIKLCKTEESIIETIRKGLEPFRKELRREITRDDLVRLSVIPIKRISKYSSFKTDEHLREIEAEINEVKNNLDNIIAFAISYFRHIKKKYGTGRERRTELRNFDVIQATEVAAANVKLYINREEGFIGTSLKKDEFICECSDIDDVIIIRRSGSYLITRVAEKQFVGRDIIFAGVFRKNDERTIYNLIYRDGNAGFVYIKRCTINGLTRDKEYNLTRGEQGSKILYLTVNPNGEAETVKVTLKPRHRLKKLVFDISFGSVSIKGRSSMGNIVSRYPVHKVELKEKGHSTLGGMKIWWDDSVHRLNGEGKGVMLGEFHDDDKLLIMTESGVARLSGFELSSHFEEDLILIVKYNEKKTYTVVYADGLQKTVYIKRFSASGLERSSRLFDENAGSKVMLISQDDFPRLSVKFAGKHKQKQAEVIDASEFIAVKSLKAKGKRLSSCEIGTVTALEPLRFAMPEKEQLNNEQEPGIEPDEEDENTPGLQNDDDKKRNNADSNGEQMSLF